MNLIVTPKTSESAITSGEISITIGNISVLSQLYKAHPCHRSGTEVIGRFVHPPAYRNAQPTVSASVSILCFCSFACRWNPHWGQTALRGQLLKGGQVSPLQVIPLAEQFPALPLQLLEF